MKSIWKNNIKSYETINKNVNCHTTIIGGGIAGLWCAYKLAIAGKKICVLEANKLGSGVTSGSSAILSYAQDIIYGPLIKKHGLNVAKQYYKDSAYAANCIKEIVRKNNINCELNNINLVLFSTKSAGAKEIESEAEAYKQMGVSVEVLNNIGLPYKCKKGIKFTDCAQFDPLLLLKWLAEEVEKNGGIIFENSMVICTPENNEIVVNGYKVKSENFIIATHFPYINFPRYYFIKMYQSQNYSIVYKPNENNKNLVKNSTFESVDETGFEYRKVGKNILCCGASFRTGTKPYKSKYQIIKKHYEKHFGVSEEIVRFSAQDCITSDYLPYAGVYSNFLNNVYVVTGFNKWGMTNSYLTSDVVCNLILGNTKETEANVYAPNRNNFIAALPDTITNLATDIAGWANNLLNTDAKKFRRIKNQQGAIVKLIGKRVGAYRDETGKVHAVSGICPHLGCSLKWNKDELSWDCPCHGSRFDVDGNILNNPAIKNAEKINVKAGIEDEK